MKDKHPMIPLACGILKKKKIGGDDTNELICRTEAGSQTWKNLRLPKGTGGGRGGMDWVSGIGICMLR